MKLVKLLMGMIRNGDTEVSVGKDWADIVLINGKYWNVGFENEKIVNEFLKLVNPYKIANDDNSEFSVDGTYKIGKRTVHIYHYYPYTV
jgi:hypothetical protein